MTVVVRDTHDPGRADKALLNLAEGVGVTVKGSKADVIISYSSLCEKLVYKKLKRYGMTRAFIEQTHARRF